VTGRTRCDTHCYPSPRALPARRTGMALVYGAVAMVAFTAICLLTVDYGRVRVVKLELQSAADAAARAGAAGMQNGTAYTAAADVASKNRADNRTVVLRTSGSDPDVVLGHWDAATRQFIAGGTPTDSIQVTARRTAARGDAVPLTFGPALGIHSSDVRATAVATTASTPGSLGVVGVNSVWMHSNSQTDSYRSASGPYSASHSPDLGGIASNGAMYLDGNVIIRGDARRYNGTPSFSGGAYATGSTSPLPAQMTYPGATLEGYGYGNNNNSNIASEYRSGQDFVVTDGVTVNVPAGNYVFRNFRMTNGLLNVTGEATFYVNGTVFFDGDSRTSAHVPRNLKFNVIGSGKVDIWGNHGVYADLYAPDSDVEFKSNKHLYGRVVGRTVRLDSDVQVHFDESLPPPGATAASSITLVK
jgi:Flp pilus assembly protein TadG